MESDLAHELDRLYGAPLEAFVSERTRIARLLRKEDRRAEAATVQELRKPSLPVWAVNQLARQNRKDVDLLLDAGHRLTTAQVELVEQGGDPKRFDEARRQQQAALRKLQQAARAILGSRATAGTLDRIVATLRAAAVSPEAREQLARGNLTTELAPSGFESLAGIQPAPPPPRAERKKQERKPAAATPARAEKEAARREAIDRAQQALTKAREREAASATELREAERAVRTARAQLDSAEKSLQRARKGRESAAEAVEAARAALDEARSTRP